MNDALLVILSTIGLLALYWVLFGQWKYNNMIREADKISEKVSEKLSGKKNEEKPSDKAK